jgi:hypothetical protein
MSQPVAIRGGVRCWCLHVGRHGFVRGSDVQGVLLLHVQRGRSDYSQPFQAGTCTVTFRNLDGALDPDNASGPYFGKIQPGRRLRFSRNT